MKNFFKKLAIILSFVLFFLPFVALAVPLPINQGGTGLSTLSGIPYGTGTAPLSTLTISSPLSFSMGMLGIPAATGSQNGYLSSTDWTTFNNKQSSLTLGNLTAAGTDGIAVTGGTGAVIGSGTSLAQHIADATHNGYLSSTDWSTFNGKQPAGTYVTAITITSANGISGSSSGGATPALTLALGTITPTTVNGITLSGSGSLANSSTSSLTSFTGSGTSSGTNTGDQTTTGTSNRISVATGTTNPVIDISASYVGQASITTLGTIGTGTWAGTAIAVNHGGTSQTSYTDGQLLIGNSTGNTLAKGTITAGTGISVTNGGGSITIAATGGTGTVTSVASADGSITVTNPTSTVDLAVVKAPILSTARNIGGVSFNGSAAIVPQTIQIVDAGGDTTTFPMLATSATGSLQPATDAGLSFNATTDALTATAFVGALTGNADTATTLATGRTISISGDLTYTSPSFNGSGNVTAAGTLATVNSNVGTFGSATKASVVTVNGKGLVTAASESTVTPAVGSITGLGTGVATFLATPSSSNLLSAVTGSTGTGALVFGTSPTLTTASLGSSTATTQSPSDGSTKVATTAYVDAAVLGTDFKEAALVATTGNLVGIYLNGASGVGATFTYTATGTDTIDGTTLALGNRVLVKNQTTTFQNGIYSVTTAGAIGIAGVLTRTTDFNQSAEIDSGDTVFITSGTVNTSTTWTYNGVSSPTIGTDAITFVQISGPGLITSGNGITVTGLSIAIDTGVTVDKTTAQTLTNKTLTSPILTTPAINGTPTGTGIASANTASTLVLRDGSGNFTAGTITAALTGNASTATALATGRTISISGDITYTSPSFDGSGNVTAAGTLATVNANTGSFGSSTSIPTFTVNGKGLITAASGNAVIAPAGTLTGATLASGVTTSSLVSFGNNPAANNFLNGFTTAATAAGTTTLTNTSNALQYFTGSSTQTVKLPTTSVVAGQAYTIVNESTGAVTVQSSGANTITILAGGTSGTFTAIVATPTTAANWQSIYGGTLVASGKVFSVSNTLTLAGTDNSTLNIGGGGTLGTAAFTNSTAYEVPLTFSTGLTRSTNTITVNTSQNIATLSNLTSNGLVTTSGSAGTLGVTVPGTGILTWLATPSSANLIAALTDETGTGKAVFATAPALLLPTISDSTDSTKTIAFSLSGMTTAKTLTLASAQTTTQTLNLPNITGSETLVGKATTDTFTNKTYDTAGTGNSFSINGVAVTANTGTGAVARASSPAFTTPNIGVAAGTSLAATGVLSSGANSGTGGQLTLNGATSGSGVIQVNAAAGAGIIFQLPSSNGSNGNVLTTNGSGVTSWTSAGSGDITAVGDCTASDCFTGTSGTTLTFDDPDGDKTFLYNTTSNRFNENADLDIIGTTDANTALKLQTTLTVGTQGPLMELYFNKGTPVNGDLSGAINFTGNDSTTSEVYYGGMNMYEANVTHASLTGRIDFILATNAVNTTALSINGASTTPGTNDGSSLGTTSTKWSDLFLASGAVINFNSGNMTLTHSAGALTVDGGSLVVDATADFAQVLKLKTTTSSGTGGPIAELYYNKTTVATNDSIGAVGWYGNDSTSLEQFYGDLNVYATDPTHATRSARLDLRLTSAGSTVTPISIAGTSTTLSGNGLILAAGTTSLSPLKFTSGTLNTSAAAGALEFDGTAFYATSVASSRQVVEAEQFISLTSGNTLTSQTAAQPLFDGGGGPANGALTVPASTSYQFECYMSLSSLSTTSGSFGFAFGGTATITSQAWLAEGFKQPISTALSMSGVFSTAANTTIVLNSTIASGWAYIRGIVRINTAGTLIPEISQTQAAAAVVGANSYCGFRPVGSNTVVNVGNWN